jgi:cyclopropane fatty-acyl-phospholipid synthase-like methyltransferase
MPEVTTQSSEAASQNGAPAAAPQPASAGPLEELMRAAAGQKERPKAWTDAGSYPWADEEFSARYVRRANYQELYGMKETGEEVDELITLLNIKPKARVLDICSGNGRHSIALALRGCKMTGVDLGPGPIALAKETSRNLGLTVDYRQIDALTISFEDAYDAIVLTCGGLSDFSPASAKDLFARAERALVPGGMFVAEFLEEPSANADVRSWRFVSAENSLFADAAHLQLDERLYDKDAKAEVTRTYIVSADGKMRQITRSRQYYSEDDIKGLLAAGSLQLVGFSAGSAPGYKRVLAKKR